MRLELAARGSSSAPNSRSTVLLPGDYLGIRRAGAAAVVAAAAAAVAVVTVMATVGVGAPIDPPEVAAVNPCGPCWARALADPQRIGVSERVGAVS